ncbi:hypothetical protein [Methylobacterium sp. J-067]|nr:hypothetical protein [Methylobacterium sp. J-067]
MTYDFPISDTPRGAFAEGIGEPAPDLKADSLSGFVFGIDAS